MFCQVKQCQTADKPGSVPPEGGDGHSSGTPVAGRLARPTRTAARKPARPAALRREPPICRPYMVLLPVGLAVPRPLPAARCALTAPFHPCRRRSLPRRLGGLLSVALPWGRPRRALPGTVSPWSPDFPPSDGPEEPAKSGHLAVWQGLGRLGRRGRQPISARRAARMPQHSASGSPLRAPGRKWRWKAVTTARVSASRRPVCSTP